MFPERMIADGFWYFVRCRAIDYRTTDSHERAGSRTLDKLDIESSEVRQELAGKEEDEMPTLWDESYLPWTYATVQEALIAYLINQVALGAFPYSYEMWLRAITLVMVDVQRDLGWLHVIACDWDSEILDCMAPDDPERRTGRQRPRDMVITDDWSCLSREVFDFAVREYTGKG